MAVAGLAEASDCCEQLLSPARLRSSVGHSALAGVQALMRDFTRFTVAMQGAVMPGAL